MNPAIHQFTFMSTEQDEFHILTLIYTISTEKTKYTWDSKQKHQVEVSHRD